MSMELMVQAMKVKVGNPLRKLVLLKLADNASDQGECWPSYQHIADQCEISRRSVMNHINALCLSGLMIKETRTGPKGNTSNFYRLTLDGASDKQDVVQHIHQGVVQEIHPESVTLLNQSKNQKTLLVPTLRCRTKRSPKLSF